MNPLTNEGACALARSLETSSIKSLDISYCAIRSTGTVAIAKASTRLTTLDISGNPVGASGARALGELCMTIECLYVRHCQLCDMEMYEFVSGISGKSTTLTSLALSWNPFENAGALVLAMITPKLTRIEYIGLEGTSMRDHGVYCLLKALCDSPVKSLCLCGNDYTSVSGDAFALFLHKSRSIQSLGVNGVALGRQGILDVARAMMCRNLSLRVICFGNFRVWGESLDCIRRGGWTRTRSGTFHRFLL